MNSVNPRTRLDKELLRARLRGIAFEALYGPFAWAYDWVSRTFFLGQWRPWQRATIRYLKGHRILEVGMGTGNLQVDLMKAGYETWGIDLSPQMLREAARKIDRLGIPPFKMCRARVQALPFPDSSFDSLVSTFPTDYIADKGTWSEAARVLRPQGRVVIVAAGWLTPKGARGELFQRVAGLVYGDESTTTNAVILNTKVRERIAQSKSLAGLRKRASEAGFRLSMHVASNQRGAALLLVADKIA